VGRSATLLVRDSPACGTTWPNTARRRGQSGAETVEPDVLLAFIAITIIVLFALFGQRDGGILYRVNDSGRASGFGAADT
jgi:Flp pilus assembly pilin Flp